MRARAGVMRGKGVSSRIAQSGADDIADEKRAQIIVNVHINRHVRADKAGFVLQISRDRQIVFDIDIAVAVFILRRQINEVVDVVIKETAVDANAAQVLPQTQLDAVRAFAAQILVADFKRYRSDVRSEIVKLL
jgi:hypothetical protein